MGGPTDTEFLFDMFLSRIRDRFQTISIVKMPPPRPALRTVLLLGSGGLSIGQAGEFDYRSADALLLCAALLPPIIRCLPLSAERVRVIGGVQWFAVHQSAEGREHSNRSRQS